MADNQDHRLSRTMSASAVPGIMDRAASVFNALDLDKDGILNSTEIQSVQEAANTNGVVTIFDACNSAEGQVTFAEFSLRIIQSLTLQENVLDMLSSLESKVSEASLPPPFERAKSAEVNECASMILQANEIFARIDENDSGLLEWEEILKLVRTTEKAQFTMSEIDQNKDGKLSAAEFTKYFMKIFTVSGPDKAMAILSKLDADLTKIGR
ncbi:hypothetical protein CYMTET_30329 [Cymbomonas tetramitiformis]|uniref:EF-hand domain-containing protein n=1 Tax=Cymbomonas tetramitiformis TaxID=36881 RepID=A0AAE0FJS0_9CHLO|nr:hypothetical protein CYMTET_30329 [Cymbomonas tetramitiformis]|eukprot:gene15574-18464_t